MMSKDNTSHELIALLLALLSIIGWILYSAFIAFKRWVIGACAYMGAYFSVAHGGGELDKECLRRSGGLNDMNPSRLSTSAWIWHRQCRGAYDASVSANVSSPSPPLF